MDRERLEFVEVASSRYFRARRGGLWRWSPTLRVGFCCLFLAAGPTVAMLLPVSASENESSSEEESQRIDTEEFCSRVPARRNFARQLLAAHCFAVEFVAGELVSVRLPESAGRLPAQLDLDAKLGSGAPLRC